MQSTDSPTKVVLPFANAGGRATLPVASQIGITDGAASFTDGFPPLTRTPITSGGVPPNGLEMNGILYLLSAGLWWLQAGGSAKWDSAFSTAIGGYPLGAVVQSSDNSGWWRSTAENNTTNPDAGGAGWVPHFGYGQAAQSLTNVNVTLTATQALKSQIVLTGVLSANVNLIFPAGYQNWLVINNTTGAFNITAKTAAGSGVVLGAGLWITWWFLTRKENLTPPPKASKGEIWDALRRATWALMLPVIILVGLRMGVFTPTEAAVVAAVYALFVAGVIYRELTMKQLFEVFVASAKTTAVVMFLVAAAMVSAWMITVANLPDQVISLLQPLLDRPTVLMFAIMILCMIVGTAMDMTPTILILTPVLMPLVKAAGIDPVYFGVLFIINNSIGLVTPPVGTVLNVVAGVGRMRMDDVTRGVMPFMAVQFIVMFLMVLFPSIVMVPARWFY